MVLGIQHVHADATAVQCNIANTVQAMMSQAHLADAKPTSL
jgi:hypothetical protein